ncbi:MAG TPA: histidinol-phosphate transaminase, partial [Armatimonadota bacterium]|nr:histidinol-phosphate transaminase [Armatimonadota bacterium]
MSPRLCKECVLRLKPYIPGKPIEEVQREYGLTDIVKLASNENPL